MSLRSEYSGGSFNSSNTQKSQIATSTTSTTSHNSNYDSLRKFGHVRTPCLRKSVVLDGSNDKSNPNNWTMPDKASSGKGDGEHLGDTSLYEDMGQLTISGNDDLVVRNGDKQKKYQSMDQKAAISVLDRVLLRRRQIRETAAGKQQKTNQDKKKLPLHDSSNGKESGHIGGISAGENSNNASLSNEQTAYGRATEELQRLRTQVTDYQVQLKLQSDFIRHLMDSEGFEDGEISGPGEIEDLSSDSSSMKLLESMLSEISEWIDDSFGDLVAKVSPEQLAEFDKSDDLREKLVIARSNFSDSLERCEMQMKKLADLGSTAKEMQKQLEDDVGMLKDQGVKISGLESSLSKYKTIQGDLVKLRQSYEQLQLKLLKAETEKQRLEKEKKEIAGRGSDIRNSQNGDLQQQREDVERKQKQIDQQQEEIDQQQQENFRQQEKIDLQQQENVRQQEKINVQREKIASLESELRAKEAEIDEMSKKVEAATGEMSNLRNQVRSLKKQASGLAQRPSKNLETRNIGRQVASLPGTPIRRMLGETKDESQADLAVHINFQTHALRILSRLLDRRSIREAAGKVLQLANRNRLQLPETSVRQLRTAVDEYLLAGIDTVVQSRLELAHGQSIDASQKSEVSSANDRPSSTGPDNKTVRLRLDELTRRWKAAEEALGFERKQSQRRLDELDMENDRLKSQIKELEDRH
ncbi:hypothetical protein BRETT_000281 [Brettanomyces bruxellensis]|uniref:Uncharacterized protein n=1 Tax=Dekkera bruxellensis TaxID=5007 RepID=A0A871RDD6_DEKBR|nr:uncharacterized protein BRETT_000281 [Brettanomyces bruxellensis]QOU20571.1 hypothetical protein BRETT_000281 [Brettanomyces bruxellensis]